LSRLLRREVKVRHVPVAMLDVIVAGLSVAGRFSIAAAEKAELARIGRYYATQSMLVLDPATGRYDAAATPSFGSDTLFDYYGQLVWGEEKAERGEHAVF
jgi:divinyl chlorophyllide a 8-vinyl-reductase